MGDAAMFLMDKVVAYSDAPGKDDLVERIQQIQQMSGFGPDGAQGQMAPEMMEQLQAMIVQTVQQMVPQPEQLMQAIDGLLTERLGRAIQ
jgi:hypothetical protein